MSEPVPAEVPLNPPISDVAFVDVRASSMALLSSIVNTGDKGIVESSYAKHQAWHPSSFAFWKRREAKHRVPWERGCGLAKKEHYQCKRRQEQSPGSPHTCMRATGCSLRADKNQHRPQGEQPRKACNALLNPPVMFRRKTRYRAIVPYGDSGPAGRKATAG